MSKKPGLIKRLLLVIWSLLTRLRQILANLIFLLLLVVIVMAFRDSAPEALPETAALVVNPVGSIVEERAYTDPFTLLFAEPLPAEQEVLLRDVVDAIVYAKEDPAITALVLELDQLLSVGISKSSEILTAIEYFRSSGKPVIARGDYYSQGQYLLASQADTVLLHPFGGIDLQGFSNYQMYFKDLLEKMSLSMHVFRAGDYKSFVEPFTRNDMSAHEKELSRRWLERLWETYTKTVEERRGLEPGALQNGIDNYASALAGAGGDPAQLALAQGLVDELVNWDESDSIIAEHVGARNDEGYYQGVGFGRYLAQKRPIIPPGFSGDSVGVITASGAIQNGEQPAGSIGGESLSALIDQALKKDSVKAIVLRVDSGGGSVFASEVIRQKLLEVEASDKPLVVSMGSVAASGGYWIAMPADEVWATATTITGSIGVFAAFPTAEKLFNRLGVYVDGVGTTELAGAFRIDRPLNPQLAQGVQANVDNLYSRFINLVADGRSMSLEDVDAVAGGRVWSGYDALELGLVDELGGLDDAIVSAARLAQMADYEILQIATPLTPQETFLRQLREQVRVWGFGDTAGWQQGLARIAAPLRDGLSRLAEFNDPAALYVRCDLCVVL
ncbi:signal peptide peptidase SppA [Halieaceae bacterium IMCC14734]|uniref:Signal peptide peptidase SppA n=1 Tax=Candidatus Litorirhabdus singularis TaxID=2518993 RepID=A0ABT3TAN8_9GAMM|nr:signal peptide peptidase SppA [Candidatus Litorirhabdus singularis]MCX2979260.1 signal peptide peptidase SppA [Candidatus Litorirhabdus singularis]